MMRASNDQLIVEGFHIGILRVDLKRGIVYAARSNFPDRPGGSPTRKGYLRIGFTVNSRKVHAMVHRIVWIAAYGAPDDQSAEVNNKSGIKTDNRICNLELLSGSGNIAHAMTAGLLRPVRGEAHGHARLTAAQIDEIKRRSAVGEKSRVLATEFSVTQNHIRNIVTGRRWAPNQRFPVGKRTAGRLLDGRTWDEFPRSAS